MPEARTGQPGELEARAGLRTEIRAELVIELAPGIRLAIEVPADAGITLTPDDADALRARAVDLVELTRRRLAESTFHRNPRTNENEGDER